MADAIRILVLGQLRVLVDGEDRTDRLTGPQRTLLALLAGVGEPIDRQELRRSAGLAPSSMDAELSRIRRRIGAPHHLHRSRTPMTGWVALDPRVTTDLDDAEVIIGTATPSLDELLAVDDWWRDSPLPELVDAAGDPTVSSRGLLQRARDRAWWLRRRSIEQLVETLSSDGGRHLARDAIGRRIERWEADHPAAANLLGGDGDQARHLPADALSPMFEAAQRGLDRLEHRTTHDVLETIRGVTEGRDRWRVMLLQADAMRLGARWEESEPAFRAALAAADDLGDDEAVAETVLALARIVWQPGPLASFVEERARRLLRTVESPGLVAELSAVLAGGLYQSGALPVGGLALARRALGSLDRIEDPHRRAEALVRCRNGLLGVDPPAVQRVRAQRILDLAGDRADLRSAGLLALVVDSLHAADVTGARRAIAAHGELARADPTGLVGFHQSNLDTVVALIDGRVDAISRLIDRMQELGARFGGITVAQMVVVQRLFLGRLRDDRSSLEGFVELVRPTRDAERHAAWDAGFALALSDLGRVDEAEVVLGELTDRWNGFDRVPDGPHRLPSVAMAAEAAATVVNSGHRSRGASAEAARHLDEEHLDGVLIGWPTVYLGPTSRFRALAAGAARQERRRAPRTV